jgi:hypothetical protein
VAYLLTWYNGVGAARAQTIAFVTWLLANRLMIGWAAATVVFVLIATLVPAAQVALKTASLSSQEWALAVGAALVGTCCVEARKWLGFRGDRSISPSAAASHNEGIHS